MITRVIFIALLCLPAPAAFAQSDCTLGAPKPLLKDSRAAKVTRARKGPRDLAETIRVPGFTVEVSQGGCTHYGVKFRFPAKAAEADVISEAAKLITRLKPHSDSHVITEVLAVLASAKGKPYTAGEPLQDREYPMVTLYITPRARGAARKLEVLYSFVP